VHSDISPPNVFVTYEGEVKVLDFGVAKSIGSQVRTQVGILKGKAAYMAPEMVAGQPFDGRADLYAVGVMLWEATAGRERWPNMTEMAILTKLARGGPIESPGATERGLPELADRICLRALAGDPNERYQTAAELRAELLELCQLLGGRPGPSLLKDFLAQRFATERAREEREIDSALALLQQGREGGARSDERQGGSTKRIARRPSDTPILAVEQPTQPSKTRGRALLGVALVVAIIAVGVKLLKSAPEAAAGAAPSSSAPHAVEVPAVASAVPSSAPGLAPAPLPAPEPAVKAPGKKRPAPAAKKPAARPGSDLSLDREDPWK
jgi:serine/threonine-protein kinase